MQSFSKHFANLLPAVLVFSQFRLRRVFSGSVHYSWVHCHLASVSLDFACLIYRVWLRLRFGPSLFRSLIFPFHFRKHHIDSSVMRRHALCSLSFFLSSLDLQHHYYFRLRFVVPERKPKHAWKNIFRSARLSVFVFIHSFCSGCAYKASRGGLGVEEEC